MNESYFNSGKNTALSSKPSTSIRLLLMVLFVFLFGNTVFGQSIGDYRSNGNVTFTSSANWQVWNGSSWIAATSAPTSVPSTNVITVSSPNTASVSGTVALSASLAVSGTVNLANNSVFTLGTNSNWANITINSGGSFNMPGGSGLATLILNGNYYNNGVTDFWKSNAVITGDLLSPSSSALQNQGNIIVGGNIIGDFNLSGSGSNQIYAVNPNATVTITPATIDSNVIPGTQLPTSEGSTLIDLVNTIILGNNSCSFTLTDPPSNIYACAGGNISTTITTTASSPSYQWQINSGSGWSDLSGQTSATLTLASVTVGMTGNKYRVKVTSSSCTKNGNYVTLTVNPNLPASVSISASANSICTGTSVTFTASPTNGGTAPTYQWKLNNVNVGTNSATYTNATLANGNTVTCVMTSNATPCLTGSPATSNTVTMVVSPSAPSAPGPIAGSATQCAGATTQVYSVAPVANATSYDWHIPSDWTITSGLGTNSITVTVGTVSNNVYVNAINACGTGYGPYQYVTVNPIPSAPGTAGPNSPSCTGFTAQWAWTANATKYYLDVSTNSGFSTFVSGYNNLDVGNVTNYSLTGLNPGTTYYYRVRAYSNCGTSASSSTMNYATTAIPTTAPTVSAATNIGCDFATLNWNSVANATAYYLDIATDSGFTTFVSGYNNLYLGYYPSGYFAGSLPAGTLYYRVRATNTCGVITANSNTISFSTPAPIGGTVSSAQSIYSGTSPADLTLTGYSATNIIYWQKSTDAAFTSPTNITETTATLSGTTIGNLFADTYFRAVVQNQFGSWCISNSNPVLITVMVVAAPLPPITSVVHPSCAVPTGSITVTSPVPAADITYTVVGTNPVVAGVTNTTGVFSGLTAGDYNVIVNNTATGLSTGKSETINAIVTNTWSGASWSNGTPNSNQKIVFSGNYSSTGNVVACSCMVTSGAVTFNSTHTLTLTNELKVTAGSLIFENNSSLVQNNDSAVNLGNITYKRTTSSVLTSDYTYWSSPVANQTLNITPSYASGMFYSYDDFAVPEDWKSESISTTMIVGKGYIIRGPHLELPPPPGLYNATFTGVPNNGIKTIAIGPAGTSNLLGNPYPSVLDADAFLATNSALVEGTIYFWTHNTAIQLASNITNGTAGSGALAYTSDDYASYNTTGGVGTGNIENGAEEFTNRPTGKIAAGQAFFTTSLGAGTVTFNNGMRVSGNNSQFFKTRNPKDKSETSMEKNRVWLNLTNKKGAFKQTLVGYVSGATNLYDSRFDGESLDANEFVDFYSINDGKNLVIQGRALPFDQNDQVPLGYRTTIDGTFTISIDEVDGAFANQSVYLEDKLTNTEFDLKSGNYTFNTIAGTFNERFVLKYSSKTLGTGDFDTLFNKAVVSVKDKQIKINSFSGTIDKVVIHDLSGRQIYQKDQVNSNELSITNLISGKQTLVVKTTLQNGETSTDKIIY